jgi:hypothetical protein
MDNNTKGRPREEKAEKFLDDYNFRPDDVINFSGLSKALTGSYQPIKKNKIPHKYTNKVAALYNVILRWKEEVDRGTYDK